MYSEHELKKQIVSIESSGDRAVTKVRKLLRISRALKRQLYYLKRRQREDPTLRIRSDAATRIDRSEQHIRMLIEDVRIVALRWLSTSRKKKMGYETTRSHSGPVFHAIK